MGRLALVRRLALFALALLLPIFVLGCGGGEEEDTAPETVAGEMPTQEEEGGGGAEGDPDAGKEVFASAGCGNCHTFEPAGSTGTTAPNLDESQVTFDQAVEQIRTGGGGMPAFEGDLSDQEIADVAAFVTSGG
jgi:mono/diheme cytochrome c family protein